MMAVSAGVLVNCRKSTAGRRDEGKQVVAFATSEFDPIDLHLIASRRFESDKRVNGLAGAQRRDELAHDTLAARQPLLLNLSPQHGSEDPVGCDCLNAFSRYVSI
jgi:hypothetical protein